MRPAASNASGVSVKPFSALTLTALLLSTAWTAPAAAQSGAVRPPAVEQQVARLGQAAGFEVRLCDTREPYRRDWHWGPEQGGIAVEWCDPERFVERHATARSAVLALAHDPRIDDAGLMVALESEAFYLGAMGSVRTSARRLERLQRIAEASQTQLARIHAPIGLPIGSKTPIEIAIAVLAEVIAVRQGIRLRDATDAA